MASRTSRRRVRTAVALLLGCALIAAGCTSGSRRGATGSSASPGLAGAGATFPAPLYAKWLSDFQRTGTNAGVKVTYQAVGSGEGVKRFMSHQVDFGASDVAMTDDELAAAEEDGGPVLHVPTVIGAVTVAYSLPGGLPRLRMDGRLVGDIFLGKVRSWNDPAIAAQNPGVALPDLPITVVHRSDSSGTTANFTGFVVNHSPEFKARVGTGKGVRWPVGVAAQGSSGVARRVRATSGAIGYVELTYALDQGLGYAAVENAAGRFVVPSPESMAAAAAGLELVSVINNFRVSLIDATGSNAYPITSWTFLLVRESQPDPVKARTLANLLWYMTHQGQASATSLHYAPLPSFLIGPIAAKVRLISGPDGHALSVGS
jgi:phosphate transport system substrate-binding protein